MGKLVFYAKKMKKIVFLILFFLISFSFGWIVCVSQVYDFFDREEGRERGLYFDVYDVKLWPLMIYVEYSYNPAEKNNDPILENSFVNIKLDKTVVYPDLWEKMCGKEAPLIYASFPQYFSQRKHYIKEEIEKIRYPVEFHSNYSKKELNME